jgi:rhodanese-related sulfurtransferase
MFSKPELTVQEVAALLKAPQPPQLLDVREAPEWGLAHLPGSQPFTEALMNEAIGTWDKGALVVTVCHHGIRSLNAARFLMKQGFTNVRSMKGGMEAWSLEVNAAVQRY